MAGRHNTEKLDKTPGKEKHFCHSIMRIILLILSSLTAAPGAYSPEKCNLNQPAAFSFGLRPEQKVRSDTPAPNQYSAEKCNFNRTPSFTMRGRRKVEKPDLTPGQLNVTILH